MTIKNDWLQGLREEAFMFAKGFLRPHAHTADCTGNIPNEVLAHPFANVLSKAYVPRRYGGGIPKLNSDEKVECSSQLSIALTEELAWGDPGITCGLPGPSLTFPVLLEFGNEDQRERYFGLFREKQNVWGAFAITESHCGTDATSLTTKATAVDGGFLLNGTKCFVTNGTRADYVIVFATVDRSQKQFGLRSFIVDANTPGFKIGSVEKMMGLRGSGICEIVLDDCFVPNHNLLQGNNNKPHIAGFLAASAAWHFFRIEVSAICVGIARAIYDELKGNCGITLPDLARDIQIGRSLCQKAAALHDQREPANYEIAVAKAYNAQLALSACTRGIEILGAPSLIENHLFSRLFRASKVFNILEGSGEIQREHITHSLVSH